MVSSRSGSYGEFLHRRAQRGEPMGFEPVWMPDFLFDFQRHLVDWAVRRGRAAIFADCGMGKTAMQLVWAENVRRHTGGSVLICTPLAVAAQTAREAEKFGVEASRSQDGKHSSGVVITNYERLERFDPRDFVGIVCDESSIMKSFGGKTRKLLTRFMSKLPYRLPCTATAAPNDYIELGTTSEALGELSYTEMLKRFFAQLDDKGQKRELDLQEQAESLMQDSPEYFAKLAYRVAQMIGQYRLRHHAVTHFWRWVSSWARACRMPSDLGFEDRDFVLPPLSEQDHVIASTKPPPGMLFTPPAFGMAGERAERRRLLHERCDYVANLVNHDRPAVVWCQENADADRLVEVIQDAEQISGRTSDDRKCELYDAFSGGSLRVLVIKQKIGAWGLNWQHCNHVVAFASHSYEQYYQSVRRCWRFGQKNPVKLDVIATEGEIRVLANMRKKAQRADAMFEALVREMNQAERIERPNEYVNAIKEPSWLSKTSA